MGTMDTRPKRLEGLLPGLSEAAYLRLLNEARDVSLRCVERLYALREAYPDAIPPEALATLGPAEGSPKHDRRRGLRRGCPGCGEVRHAERLGAGFPAYVIDTSPGGVGLLLPSPVAVRSVLKLQAATVSGGRPVRVRVVHCEPSGTSWLVGCATLGS